MSKKPQTPLQGLNIELSRIDAMLSALEKIVTDRQALDVIEKAKQAHDMAFDHMITIKDTLSTL